jgi:hypothetical protein
MNFGLAERNGDHTCRVVHETIVATMFGSRFQVVWFAVSVAVYGCFSVSNLFLILLLVPSVVLRLVPSVVLSHPAAT